MNKKLIALALRICRVIRSLKSAKTQIAQAKVDIHMFDDLDKSLNESLQEIELKIIFFSERVKKAISSLSGFNSDKHILIDYISIADIEDLYIDITKNGKDVYYLRLTDGEIVSTEDVPKMAKEIYPSVDENQWTE